MTSLCGSDRVAGRDVVTLNMGVEGVGVTSSRSVQGGRRGT
jgi:hypothetical protein